MPQSLCRIYAHLIFSTKSRERWLDEAISPRVHAYLATVARDMGCPYVVVGGTDDHVHLLMDVGKEHRPVDIVAKVKRESSLFVKTLGSEYGGFHWQNGYALFSVGPARVPDVEAYVGGQEEHHRATSFQDELRAFLEKYRVAYDEHYLWD